MKARLPIAVILLSALSCRPVLTIGWGEILILVLLVVVLLGPLLYRLYRRWDEFKSWRNPKP